MNTTETLRVKSIMRPFPHTIRRDARALEASALMNEQKIRHLPVVDDTGVVGVVSDRDLKLLFSLVRIDHRVEDLLVEDAFIEDAYIVDVDAALQDVLLDMADRQLGSVLVTSNGKLAGLFTTVDVCRAFGEYLQPR